MRNDEPDDIRDALLSGLEPSAALRERFREQVERLVGRKLSTARKVGNVVCATVFLAMSGLFGYVVLFVATARDPGLAVLPRSFMCISFAAGSLGFLFAALYALRELRSGLAAPRRRQQAMVAIPAALVLLYVTAWLVFWDTSDISAARAVHVSTGLLFYWVMAVGSVLLYTIRWQREDILLEQKRTQLEVALLREDLLKGSPRQ